MSGLTGAPTRQVTNFPWNTPEQTRQLNTCIRNHRAYAGRFRSRKNAVDFSDEDNRIFQSHKAPGGPKIPTKLIYRKQLVPPTSWLRNLGFFQWARDPEWPCPEPIRTFGGVAEWEVDLILDSVLLGADAVPSPDLAGIWYRVKWVGWPADVNYYPARDFQNCPAKIEEFHSRELLLDRPEDPDTPVLPPGPPARFVDGSWHKLYIEDRVRIPSRPPWLAGDMQLPPPPPEPTPQPDPGAQAGPGAQHDPSTQPELGA